jgi:hypothetical protein
VPSATSLLPPPDYTYLHSTLLLILAPLQWIMKPAGKSRGRGIQVENSLAGVLNVRGVDEEGERNSHWIVQKYIERPLIVQGRKWDIRQWVLVTSWNPLTIWIYDSCYLRFCSVPFTLDNLSNRFVHLYVEELIGMLFVLRQPFQLTPSFAYCRSNNSIQKNSATFDASEIEGNMWHAHVFADWLEARKTEGKWDGLQVQNIACIPYFSTRSISFFIHDAVCSGPRRNARKL